MSYDVDATFNSILHALWWHVIIGMDLPEGIISVTI